MLDLIREIGQTLRNNRLRTALTGLAVAWGIFMLIVLLGAARGVVNAFNYGAEDSSNRISVWGSYTSMPYKGYKEGRRIQPRTSDIDAIMHDNPNVSSVVAFARADTAKIVTSRDFITGLSAVFPQVESSDRLTMLYGRFINTPDISGLRRSVVLHRTNAALLFGDEEKAVGGTVSSLGLAWTSSGFTTTIGAPTLTRHTPPTRQ